ncbi:hypothetical protein ACLB2K_022153 [Fragaria x ananassa]
MDEHEKERIHKAVVGSTYGVILLKGYTSSALRHSVANITQSILQDQEKVHPVFILANGFYNINGGVYLSFPLKSERGGITGVSDLQLPEKEEEQLRNLVGTIVMKKKERRKLDYKEIGFYWLFATFYYK